MNTRNTTAAAIPLIVALAGSTMLPMGDDGTGRRARVAQNARVLQFNLDSLDDDQQSWVAEHNPFGLPQTDHPGSWMLVVREGYTLAHNNVDLIADWVSFRLTREYASGTEKRPGSSAFKPDPLLLAGRRAELSDYKGWKGVYDRGHQCAAGDSKGRGRRVIRDSFFLSNMTPQASRLNQTRWRLLEQRIQNLAKARGELWLITGPVFVDEDRDGIVEYSVLGENQVAVPTHYFKIVVSYVPGDDKKLEAMAFLIPNEAIDDFGEFLVSIDEIEELTGFNFLMKLEDDVEKDLEDDAASQVWAVP
jgi:endonuclease G